jgi:hypothetical protein
LPIKVVNGSQSTSATWRTCATARRRRPTSCSVDGQRSALLIVQKNGNASTLADRVADQGDAAAHAGDAAARSWKSAAADQSLFVRAAIDGVVARPRSPRA